MSKEIEQFKELQEICFNVVSENRDDYYAGKISREDYIKDRLEAGKQFFIKVSKIITPSSTDISWLDTSAIETLKQEDELVKPKDTGLTKQEQIKLCMLEAKHGNEFIDEIVKRNFNSLLGKDYKSNLLLAGWSVTDEETREINDYTKDNYIKIWH